MGAVMVTRAAYRAVFLVGAMALAAAAAAPISSAQPAALAKGISIKSFVDDFNANAKFGDDEVIDAKTCQTNTIPRSSRRAWSCAFPSGAFVSGLAEANGKLVDVSLTSMPNSMAEVHSFRRACRYVVRVAKGGLPMGDGFVVLDLMSAASKSIGKLAQTTENGLTFSVLKETDEKWACTAERASTR